MVKISKDKAIMSQTWSKDSNGGGTVGGEKGFWGKENTSELNGSKVTAI